MPDRAPAPDRFRYDYASEQAAKVRDAIRQNVSNRQELESAIDHALKRAYKKVRHHVRLEDPEKTA